MPKQLYRTPEIKRCRSLLDERTETLPTMELTFLSPPRLFVLPPISPRKIIPKKVDLKG